MSAVAPDVLDYMDQAAFLGLRALGRGPLTQTLWIYDDAIDLAALQRFNDALGCGLLGRLVRTSRLPFGRHRWVAIDSVPTVNVATATIPRDAVAEWATSRGLHPIDPETGPGWRLDVQPLDDGGTAVALTCSHVLADGQAMCAAIATAVGDDSAAALPIRTAVAGQLLDDVRVTVRSLPDAARAVARVVRVGLRQRTEVTTASSRAAAGIGPDPDGWVIPSTLAVVDASRWDARAAELGGTPNSLLVALAAVLGKRLGRVDAGGTVTVSMPVSMRTPGDTRGNALSGVTVAVTPHTLAQGIAGVRASVREALREHSAVGNRLLAPLPLVPFVPRRLARRLEGMALGAGRPVGCSNLGDLDPAVARPTGVEADRVVVRYVELLARVDVARRDGLLSLVASRVAGEVSVSVSAYQPVVSETEADLRQHVEGALADVGLLPTGS